MQLFIDREHTCSPRWRRLVALLFAILALLAAPSLAVGQEAAKESPPEVQDIYGRTTPRQMLNGLIDALSRQDYGRAAQYLELTRAQTRANQGAELARRLQTALDAGGSLIQPVQLSNDPAGRIDDQLPTDQERIGELKAGKDAPAVPLIARSVEGPDGEIWLLSAQSLARLNAVAISSGGLTDDVRKVLPSYFRTSIVGGAPLADWGILIAAALLAYLLVRLICAALLLIIERLHPLRRSCLTWRVLNAAPAPLSIWVGMLLFMSATQSLDVAIVARQFTSQIAGALAFVAFAWFLWRLADFGTDMLAARMERGKRLRARSILIFARRALKLVIALIAVIQALDILGIDITTGLAALGIGGIAIALGAQKTVENLVGSVSVVADEPVRVGDYCKVGEVSGTVEEVGIRSTRIRTNDRTRVTIPNADFASLMIENFTPRDRFLFTPLLKLEKGLDAAGVEAVLGALREVLSAADYVCEGSRATLKAFGDYSVDIEIWSYLDTRDAAEAAYLQERLLLAFLRSIEAQGGRLALPTHAVRLLGNEESPQPEGASDASSRSRDLAHANH